MISFHITVSKLLLHNFYVQSHTTTFLTTKNSRDCTGNLKKIFFTKLNPLISVGYEYIGKTICFKYVHMRKLVLMTCTLTYIPELKKSIRFKTICSFLRGTTCPKTAIQCFFKHCRTSCRVQGGFR